VSENEDKDAGSITRGEPKVGLMRVHESVLNIAGDNAAGVSVIDVLGPLVETGFG
jgi:hypothetical protein